MLKLNFTYLNEDQPGPAFLAHFQRQWPRYEPWYFAHTGSQDPVEARAAFAQAMPALLPMLDRLASLLPADQLKLYAFLSLFQPPPFLSGCSQIALSRDHETHIVRNYDFAFERFEATIMRTCFLQPVLCVSDCLWGALDGINGAGLAISLSFGGETAMDSGFGIPIIVRYLLETCHSVADACAALQHLHSHMTYNLTLADASGATATLYLSPGQTAPLIGKQALATNHQPGALHRPYHRAVASFEREHFLKHRLVDPRETLQSLAHHFLEPPLYNDRFRQGFGTLYTAAYNCNQRSLTLRWPAQQKSFSIGDKTRSQTFTVRLNA